MSEKLNKVSNYEEPEVWKLAMDVAESAHRVTLSFPKEEIFGLSSQIRRAASSVPLNIGEGWGRGAGAANVNACRIARGSVYELRTALSLSNRLGYGNKEEVDLLLAGTVRLRQLLQAYINGMERRVIAEPPETYKSGTPS